MSANNIKLFKFSKPGKYAIWRMASIVTTGILVCGAMLTFFFIYQNIFSTLSEANIIMVLTSNLNLNLLDIDAYNRVNKSIEQKKMRIEIPQNLRNIFIYETTTTSASLKKNPQ